MSIVRSGLEYLCHPWATLPHWFALAIGPLLLADVFDGGVGPISSYRLSAIGLGGTLDTFCIERGQRWTGLRSAGIAPICDVVGLPLPGRQWE